MSAAAVQNFRGVRALLALPEGPDRATLGATLRRLGLEVVEDGGAAAAVVFADADEGFGALGEAAGVSGDGPALIALVGSEAPSRLLRVVRRRCAAFLMKPVRASGVFAALVIGVNEQAARRREAAERAGLAARLQGRRAVIKAVLRLMDERGVDDDEAFRLLRRESMRRRQALESFAAEIAAAPEPAGPPPAVLRAHDADRR